MFSRGPGCFIIFIVIALLGVDGEAQEIDDAKEFLGTWEYASVTYEGKPFDVGKNATVTITKDGWTIRRNKKIIFTTWEIDPKKSPKHLSQVIKGGKINFLMNSIYKLHMGRIIICESNLLDGPRPKKFVAGKGDGQYLVVLRRQIRKKKTELDK